jgi:hypothetical protein
MHAHALPAPRLIGFGDSVLRGFRILFALATFVINSFLDALGNATAYSEPGVYVKLHVGDPGAAGANNAAANTSRQLASFAAASGGSMTTDADMLWSNVPNAETYSHVSLWDASTAGTYLGNQALAASKTVAVGDNFRIPAGSLTISGS